MKSRNANETILGYFYQFDKTIIEILKQTDDNNIITVEGIEDIDVEKTNEVETIQCKYHEALEYNNSSIKKAIILLLRNYVNNPQANYKYTLYAYFKSGNEKLKLPLNLDYLKSNFLEYKENGKEHKVYEELNVDNTNLEKFIKVLNIELIDTDYQEQKNNVIKLLMQQFNCTETDAENFYYGNAINEIIKLATKSDITQRKINKKDFITRINKKEVLFNNWINEFIGRKNLLKKLRNDYFTYTNISPNERIFLIDFGNEKEFELKEIINCIIKKWTKILKRESNSYCPYIFINNYDKNKLIELKKDLYSDGIKFIDGFTFDGAEFNVKEICKKADYNNGIKIKFINKIEFLDDMIKENKKTKEIYQFYYNKPFLGYENEKVKHIKIQIKNINEIKEII